jgi:hypothetical protein
MQMGQEQGSAKPKKRDYLFSLCHRKGHTRDKCDLRRMFDEAESGEWACAPALSSSERGEVEELFSQLELILEQIGISGLEGSIGARFMVRVNGGALSLE